AATKQFHATTLSFADTIVMIGTERYLRELAILFLHDALPISAAELSERVRHRLREVRAAGAQVEGDERPRVATYNSYAGSIVRDHALRLGLPPDAVHVGDAGRFQLADEIVNGWSGDIDTAYTPSTLVDGIT